MTHEERRAVPPIRAMTDEEMAAAPQYKEIDGYEARSRVPVSEIHRYELALKRQEKVQQDYADNCRAIMTQMLALLPATAVDQIKARKDWSSIRDTADLVALRAAAAAAVSNTDTRLYAPVQAVRSAQSTFTMRRRRGESVRDYFQRCVQAFEAHDQAGHGWPTDVVDETLF